MFAIRPETVRLGSEWVGGLAHTRLRVKTFEQAVDDVVVEGAGVEA